MISVIYLTRKCPRSCDYCNISKATKKELMPSQWQTAFGILRDIGCEFNLILGNEPWLLKGDLLPILNSTNVPYGVYTSALESVFNSQREALFGGGLNNFSCGIDYSWNYILNKTTPLNSMEQKSKDGWWALELIRRLYPKVDCHITLTVSRKNISEIAHIVEGAAKLDVNVNINFIHWNKDGLYDFCPEAKYMGDFLLRTGDIPFLTEEMQKVLSKEYYKIQNKTNLLQNTLEELINMKWHCGVSPYDGPTIDSDGSLRLCGYRRGKRTPQYNIWDLVTKYGYNLWREAVNEDARECPGCSWSCPMMYHTTQNIKLFTEHKS